MISAGSHDHRNDPSCPHWVLPLTCLSQPVDTLRIVDGDPARHIRRQQRQQPAHALALDGAALRQHPRRIDSGVTVCHHEGIGAQDSFFELGGNSLSLTQLLAQIRKCFQLELSLAALFERPTIADIALLIESSRALVQSPRLDGEREEGVVL